MAMAYASKVMEQFKKFVERAHKYACCTAMELTLGRIVIQTSWWPGLRDRVWGSGNRKVPQLRSSGVKVLWEPEAHRHTWLICWH
eukprot:3187138-Karenia_brevis.AAC.1